MSRSQPDAPAPSPNIPLQVRIYLTAVSAAQFMASNQALPDDVVEMIGSFTRVTIESCTCVSSTPDNRSTNFAFHINAQQDLYVLVRNTHYHGIQSMFRVVEDPQTHAIRFTPIQDPLSVFRRG